jgi:hypothetical protein
VVRTRFEKKRHELRARILRKHQPLPKESAVSESTRENAEASGSFGHDGALDSFGCQNLARMRELESVRDTEVKGRRPVLGVASRLRALEAEVSEVALREPARMGERGLEIPEGIPLLRRERRSIRISKNAPEYRVHQAFSARRSEGGGKAHRLVDRCPVRYAIEMANLEEPDAQRPQDRGIEIRERSRCMPREDPVQASSKAEHTLHDGHREIPVGGG